MMVRPEIQQEIDATREAIESLRSVVEAMPPHGPRPCRPEQIARLGQAMAAHEGITHWGVSQRLFGKGDMYHRMMNGGDLRTRTAEATLQVISDNWPADLAWPADIPRPSPRKKEAT